MSESKKKELSTEEIIKLAAKHGADAAIEKMRKEEQRKEREWHNRRMKNTKLLLSNYRDFKAYSTNAVFSASQSEDIVDILDLMWDPHNRSEQIVESIKKSAVRTEIIMTHVDNMLSVYHRACMVSKKQEDHRRYEVLYDRYISDEPLTVDEIADKQRVDVRTIYLDLNAATGRMAKLIFGIDFIVGKNNG